jgi:hypothetical protein
MIITTILTDTDELTVTQKFSVKLVQQNILQQRKTFQLFMAALMVDVSTKPVGNKAFCFVFIFSCLSGGGRTSPTLGTLPILGFFPPVYVVNCSGVRETKVMGFYFG